MKWRCCRPWLEADLARLQHEPIDVDALVRAVHGPGRGGVVTFTGTVRNDHAGRTVTGLAYSAYDSMAEAECEAVVSEAESRWPVKVALAHRLGALEVGDVAVAVVVAGGHRDEAFQACRWVIDEVKRRVPIWKREHYSDGSVAWVDPSSSEGIVPARPEQESPLDD